MSFGSAASCVSRGLDRYDFAHDKLREVAYNSLSAARRHLLHQRVAEAMTAVYAHENGTGTSKTEFTQSAARLRPITNWLDCLPSCALSTYGQPAAQHLYANAEAIDAYRHALALLEGPIGGTTAQIAQVSEKLGDSFSPI